MKLGLVSAILPSYSLEKVVDTVSAIGYEALEICCWPKGNAERRYAGITHIDIDTVTDSDLDSIKAMMAEKKVEISSLGYYPNPLDPDKEKSEFYINHILKMIDKTKKLGVNRITTFVGKNKNLSVEDNLDLFKKLWAPIINKAEQSNVEIGIDDFFQRIRW